MICSRTLKYSFTHIYSTSRNLFQRNNQKFWKRCKKCSYWCILFVDTKKERKKITWCLTVGEHLNKLWDIHEIISSILKYVIKNSWWLEEMFICQVKQKRLQSRMQCHVCWEGCYCRHGAWCCFHIQDGHVGWPNLNTADVTGVSIYCSYLRSVPLPSFGRRKPLSSEEPTTWEWGQDSAVIN